VDFVIFKGREKDDAKKTYRELLNIMKRHIARVREDKNMAARDKFATDYTTHGKQRAPKPAAPAPDKGDDKNSGGRADKPDAPNPKAKA